MKYCSSCKTYHPDDTPVCPLCGGELAAREDDGHIFMQSIDKTQSHPLFVAKNICVVLSVLAILGVGIWALVTSDVSKFLVGVTAVAFAWLGVFQFVFIKMELKAVIIRFWIAITVISLLLFGHIDATIGGVLYIAVSDIIPVASIASALALIAIAFLEKRWQNYALSVFGVALVMVAALPTNCILWAKFGALHYSYVASIVSATIGLAIVVFSLTKGRKVLLSEMHKRFFTL